MSSPPTPWNLLSLRTLPASEWQGLLASAEVLGGLRGREAILRGLRGAMVFFNASLRTRTSFEIACLTSGCTRCISRWAGASGTSSTATAW